MKRKVRERQIRVACWNGRLYSYLLWENIEGGLFVGGRDIGSALPCEEIVKSSSMKG